ncbi:MAG: carboxylating nicotinate-nucleotide diphosphorylase [Acidobacteriaceae bacterium]
MDWKTKRVTAILELALIEDHVTRDATTELTLDPKLPASATILAKQDCILAGWEVIPRVLEVFRKLDAGPSRRFEVVHHPEMFDGVRVHKGQAIAVIRGNARTILACERVTLNFLQRMCGIATETRKYVDAVKGTGAIILDTRKTVPGLRLLDKYAVSCGGGQNHRMDLADGVLIKNNHISLGGGVAKVLALALKLRKPGQKIQVEVRSFEELEEALAGRADSLLLDNMTPAEAKHAVNIARKHTANIPIEVSGGITLETIRKYAQTGVTYISVGALTHSVTAIDLSMRITAELF